MLGVVPVDQAFTGFGHPATLIVALVLVASRGLVNAGAITVIARAVPRDAPSRASQRCSPVTKPKNASTSATPLPSTSPPVATGES